MPSRFAQRLSKIFSVAVIAIAPFQMPAEAADNGVAEKPLMGWSSWSSVRGGVSEQKIKEEADVMASKLESFGYTYINIDSGWTRGFDNNGRRKVESSKFPGGMKALADYLHGKGLKLGIYITPGIDAELAQANPPILGTSLHIQDIIDRSRVGNTLGGNFAIDCSRPGAAEYIQSSVNQFASWGIDYIKMDFVGPGGGKVPADDRDELKLWMAAIKKCGHPIWLELSNSLKFANVDTWKANANGWRIEGDIEDYHSAAHTITSWRKASMRFKDAVAWYGQGGPGGWNDMDSMEVGAGDLDGLTVNERYSVFTLWSVCCSPIILGPDLTKLDDADLKIITNPDVIAIQQAGRPAKPIIKDGGSEVWEITNPDGSCYVALFNLGESPAQVGVTWDQLHLTDPMAVYDLWDHLGPVTFDNDIKAQLEPHACKLIKLTPSHPPQRL